MWKYQPSTTCGEFISEYDYLCLLMVRHEQGGSHAADGYARATGEVGVCFGTSGPGATNLVTGIATAQMDSVPLVVVTGQGINKSTE